MDRPPELAAGYVRLAVLLHGAGPITPADLARATGLGAEHLGPIVVQADQAIVDVAADHSHAARSGLDRIGPTQVAGDATVEPGFRWLLLHVGRNHGFTVGQMHKVLARIGAGPVGRFHLNNSRTLVGIREDHYDGVIERLAGIKINGMAPRPGPPGPQETPKGPAAFGHQSGRRDRH